MDTRMDGWREGRRGTDLRGVFGSKFCGLWCLRKECSLPPGWTLNHMKKTSWPKWKPKGPRASCGMLHSATELLKCMPWAGGAMYNQHSQQTLSMRKFLVLTSGSIFLESKWILSGGNVTTCILSLYSSLKAPGEKRNVSLLPRYHHLSWNEKRW